MRQEGNGRGGFGPQDVAEIASLLLILLWLSLWFILPGFVHCEITEFYICFSLKSHVRIWTALFWTEGAGLTAPKNVFSSLFPAMALSIHIYSIARYFKRCLCFSLKLMLLYSISNSLALKILLDALQPLVLSMRATESAQDVLPQHHTGFLCSEISPSLPVTKFSH